MILTQQSTPRGWSISDSDLLKNTPHLHQTLEPPQREVGSLKQYHTRSSLLSSSQIIKCTCCWAGCFADYLKSKENLFLIVGKSLRARNRVSFKQHLHLSKIISNFASKKRELGCSLSRLLVVLVPSFRNTSECTNCLLVCWLNNKEMNKGSEV